MSPDIQILVDLLRKDQDTIARLDRLLDAERSALEEFDTPALKTLQDAKVKLLEALRNHSRARLSWLDEAGMTPARFRELVSRKAPSVARLVEEVDAGITALRDKNERIGLLLARGRQVNERLMDILRGRGPAAGSVYDGRGQTAPAGGGVTLAQA